MRPLSAGFPRLRWPLLHNIERGELPASVRRIALSLGTSAPAESRDRRFFARLGRAACSLFLSLPSGLSAGNFASATTRAGEPDCADLRRRAGFFKLARCRRSRARHANGAARGCTRLSVTETCSCSVVRCRPAEAQRIAGPGDFARRTFRHATGAGPGCTSYEFRCTSTGIDCADFFGRAR